MLNQGIVHPKQLASLTRALRDYCQAANIEEGTPDYMDAGRRLMFLHELGVSRPADLVKALRVMDRTTRTMDEASRPTAAPAPRRS
jgi:hypothetical protein